MYICLKKIVTCLLKVHLQYRKNGSYQRIWPWIYETKLQNGFTVWGYTGGTPGFGTFVGGTLGVKHTLAVNINYMEDAIKDDIFNNMMIAEFGR
jgi:hypothetical protein